MNLKTCLAAAIVAASASARATNTMRISPV